MGATDGYVIYERYYVDPNHALLKAPAKPIPRVEDTFVTPRAAPKPYESLSWKSQSATNESLSYRSHEPARFEEAKDPYAILSTPQAASKYGQSNGASSYARERSPVRRDYNRGQVY
jgi:hypothetical protein